MRLTLETAPVIDAITVDEIKAYLEIDHAERDGLIEDMIGAVSDYLDGPSGILGRVICAQTWTLELERWPVGDLALPIEPISSVSIGYMDVDGNAQTLANSTYQLIGEGGIGQVSARPELIWEAGAELPALHADTMFPITVSMTGGAATAGNVPRGLRTAMIMLAGHWVDNRPVVTAETMAELPLTISTLLARYRVAL